MSTGGERREAGGATPTVIPAKAGIQGSAVRYWTFTEDMLETALLAWLDRTFTDPEWQDTQHKLAHRQIKGFLTSPEMRAAKAMTELDLATSRHSGESRNPVFTPEESPK